MALAVSTGYKSPLDMRSDDTSITSHSVLLNMPSSPGPFIAPSGLVTFQHDLKARISTSPLVKVSFNMRPLAKKRPSIPFNLKRRPTTISSRSSSSSSECDSSSDCSPPTRPVSEVVDPATLTYMGMNLPPQTSQCITPRIGAKIVDRFWPEDEGQQAEESCHVPVPSRYPTALAPPPHHRRVAHSSMVVGDVPFSDQFSSRTSPEHNAGPLRFPF